MPWRMAAASKASSAWAIKVRPLGCTVTLKDMVAILFVMLGVFSFLTPVIRFGCFLSQPQFCPQTLIPSARCPHVFAGNAF